MALTHALNKLNGLKRSVIFLALAVALLSPLPRASAAAQGTDTPPAAPAGAAVPTGAHQVIQAKGGPVTIQADHMAYSGKAQTITFSGKVRVRQDNLTLTTQWLEVLLNRDGKGGEGGIRQMVAKGDVVMSQNQRRASADHAVYDPTAQTVVLEGDPKVTDVNMTLAGERITIHLETGESTVEGGVFTFVEGEANRAPGR